MIPSRLSSFRGALLLSSFQHSGFLSQQILTQGLLAIPLANSHSPGHASIVSTIRLLTNSLPLSECKMYGIPNTLNTRSFKPRTTSFACFDFIGKRIWNFVKWSITWHTQLNSPAGVFWKSIRLIYKRILRFPVQAPLDAKLVLLTLLTSPWPLLWSCRNTVTLGEWSFPLDNGPK